MAHSDTLVKGIHGCRRKLFLLMFGVLINTFMCLFLIVDELFFFFCTLKRLADAFFPN